MVLAIDIKGRRCCVRDGNCRRASSSVDSDASLIRNAAAMRAVRSLRQTHWVIRRVRPVKDICPARIKSKALRSNSRIVN